MNRVFSGVLASALAFASVGAASTVGDQTVTFDAAALLPLDAPTQIDGYHFSGVQAGIVDTGGGDRAAQIVFPIGAPVGVSAPALSISTEAPGGFLFLSADLGGEIFGLIEADAGFGGGLTVSGLTAGGAPSSFSVTVGLSTPGILTAEALGLSGTAFSLLTFSPFATAVAGTGPSLLALDPGGGIPSPQTAIEIDDIRVRGIPSPVPLPASAMLLATALAGAIVMFRKRRKRR